jgi:hypothetical protein
MLTDTTCVKYNFIASTMVLFCISLEDWIGEKTVVSEKVLTKLDIDLRITNWKQNYINKKIN